MPLVRIRKWSRLWVGRDIVFLSETRRFVYRVEARSKDNDILMVSYVRAGRKRREITFLYGVQEWLDLGVIFGRRAH